jgi:hypothetical protein
MKTLKLVRGSTELNLLAPAAGLELQAWAPKVARAASGDAPGPLIETMLIRASGTSQDDLASKVQSLHEMQRWANDYINDSAETTPVWLVAQQVSETGQRRSLVRRIDLAYESGWFGTYGDASDMADIVLAVERDPYWEAVTVLQPGATASPSAAAVVVVDYTTGGSAVDIVGDVGARLEYEAFLNTGNDPLGRLWVGLRSENRHPGLASFNPLLECEGGTLGTDAAAAADATASPGGAGNLKVTVTPGTATWAKRVTVVIPGGSNAVILANMGMCLRLLRCKVSAGTWEIRIDRGLSLMADADLARGSIVSVSSTSWNYYEMGVDRWPPHEYYDSMIGSEGQSALHIFARRTSGAGTLDLDCVCSIPVDEGFAKIGPFNASAQVLSYAFWADLPRAKRVVVITSVGYEMPAYASDGFTLPPGDGRMVIVYARNAVSDITDAIQIGAPKYVPRWLSLRGAE